MQPLHGGAIGQILQLAASSRRREINQAVYEALGGRVAAGPFEGMVLPDQSSWLDGDIAPKLLGVYEAELHDVIRRAAAGGYSAVVNVGCAEGYYAIGLARLMPGCQVYAFDISGEAQKVCHTAAVRNGVGDRIVVGGRCDAEMLDRIASRTERLLLLLDCEGAEKELLDPVAAPAIRSCDFVAECHDFYDREITPAIIGRFSASHDITIIREGYRDPNAIPMLASLGSLDRWLTVCEFRPETMHWLIGTLKPATGQSPGAGPTT